MKINAELCCSQITAGVSKDIIMNINVSRRTPEAGFSVHVPAAVSFDAEKATVNVIGRGQVLLTELHAQSCGRCAVGYEKQVGIGTVEKQEDGSYILSAKGLDLRPDNGIDVQLCLPDTYVEKTGVYSIEIDGTGVYENETAADRLQLQLEAVSNVTDFHRVLAVGLVYDTTTDYQSAEFAWSGAKDAEEVKLLQSVDKGESWTVYCEAAGNSVQVQKLEPDKEYWFCLEIKGGAQEGHSNIAKLYSGMYNVRTAGKAPVDGSNGAEKINSAIAYLHELGGGTLLFEGGEFSTTTIHLQSNVYLYIDKTAQISALKGCDDEEESWYSDIEYRQSQTHITMGPYITPENWMTKQDAGHSYWRNSLFYGQRLDNIKIIGNGRIAGNENLTKSNMVMEMESGCRADKMVALKLCTNFEMGGLSVGRDLWYKETDKPNEDEPYYLDEQGNDSGLGIDNMLHVSNGGHFVVLATGVDGISTHDIYAEKGSQVRDIFDYMECNDMLAFNIYAEGAADDVVKLGSDCALGFTRPGKNYVVRNIIGDTECNLFQIGSETADDITDVCIDNMYVLASNKAGFSISVNDGGYAKNVHLNCGGSAGCCRHGITHGSLNIGYQPAKLQPHKSVMRRSRTSIFLSLSCRGRVLGGEAIQKEFVDDIGVVRDEVLVGNVNIGKVENVFLRYLEVTDAYRDSQGKSMTKSRWTGYNGQARTTPLIVGYKIPDKAGITLPDGSISRDIENVVLEEIDMIVKGGNPLCDADSIPRELGAGQFNLRNLSEDDRGSKIPAYGYYARHVDGLVIRDCKVDFEENDDRYAVVCDDVKNVTIENFQAPESANNKVKVKLI